MHLNNEPFAATDDNPKGPNRTARIGLGYCLFLCLVSVTLLCVLVGGVTLKRASEQRRSVELAESVYGRVMYDFQRTKDGAFEDRAASPLPAWLVKGFGLHVWHSAVFLDLDSELVTNATLAELNGLRDLHVLHISNTSVTDDGLEALKELPDLRILTLHSAGISDNALRYLSESTALEELQVSDAAITDSGLEHLKRMHTLRRLYLDGNSVTDAGIQQLQNALPKCKIDYSN